MFDKTEIQLWELEIDSIFAVPRALMKHSGQFYYSISNPIFAYHHILHLNSFTIIQVIEFWWLRGYQLILLIEVFDPQFLCGVATPF